MNVTKDTRELVDAKELIEKIKNIDVKKMSLDHDNEQVVKFFRFGNYNMGKIIIELIEQLKVKDENTIP